MADQSIRVRATRDQVRRVLSGLVGVMCSNNRDARDTMRRVGLALLGRIHAAFLVKSAGGTDEAGDRWPPLHPKTVAYSRRAGRTRTERRRDAFPSQALTKRQQDRWWEVYRLALGKIAGHKRRAIRQENERKRLYPDQAATITGTDKGRAAAIAWATVKREGATTLLQKYGGMKVDILQHTKQLERSLRPGSSSQHQVVRVGPGEVAVGTTRPGAAAHHHGAPSRKLPQRRLWPEVAKWPASWWADITGEIKQGLFDLAVSLVQRIKK